MTKPPAGQGYPRGSEKTLMASCKDPDSRATGPPPAQAQTLMEMLPDGRTAAGAFPFHRPCRSGLKQSTARNHAYLHYSSEVQATWRSGMDKYCHMRVVTASSIARSGRCNRFPYGGIAINFMACKRGDASAGLSGMQLASPNARGSITDS